MFKVNIGLEIHAELGTDSKMFCGCVNRHFGVKPNTHTCPVCLGLPGALPYPNKKAVDWTIMLGLALNCKINKFSKFDRKHYFYPDLPKGYQISQYDEPISVNGNLKLQTQGSKLNSSIRIRRVHLEEDTGKLLHKKIKGLRLADASGSEREAVTLVDFNRSGVPLVEIVTEPDLHSGKQSKEFAQKLQKIIRYLGISDCDMEKGSMRLEANISLQTKDLRKKTKDMKLPNYKVEVKNINSFRFLEHAINYEIKRQSEILRKGETPRQETRGWSEEKSTTLSQRFKETEADYRYFPEPDIPPMEFSDELIRKIKNSLPTLPDELQEKFLTFYKLPVQYIEVLLGSRQLASYSEEAFKFAKKLGLDATKVAGAIVNKSIDTAKYTPEEFVKSLSVKGKDLITKPSEIEAWVDEALAESTKAVADYKKGKVQALAAILGAVMRKSKGKADPNVTRKILEQRLRS